MFSTMWTVVRKPNNEWYIGGSPNPKDYLKHKYEVYQVRTTLGKDDAIRIAMNVKEGKSDMRVGVYSKLM